MPPSLSNASYPLFHWQTLSKTCIAFHCWPVDADAQYELPNSRQHIMHGTFKYFIHTEGRFPLRKISIGSDQTGLFSILCYPHRRNKKVEIISNLYYPGWRIKGSNWNRKLGCVRVQFCSDPVRSHAYFPEWQSVLKRAQKLPTTDIKFFTIFQSTFLALNSYGSQQTNKQTNERTNKRTNKNVNTYPGQSFPFRPVLH